MQQPCGLEIPNMVSDTVSLWSMLLLPGVPEIQEGGGVCVTALTPISLGDISQNTGMPGVLARLVSLQSTVMEW